MADDQNLKNAVKTPSGKPRPGSPGFAGPGRPKGMKNKSTGYAREAIARFVDGNAERLQEWLDQIAAKDGAKAAMACFIDLIEYHVPKLSRAEVTGKDGADLIPRAINVVFPDESQSGK